MKAYSLSIHGNDDAGCQIVFAKTAKAAKRLVHGDVYDNLEEYIDLRVRRSKEYDDMENLAESELACKQWRNGCIWFDIDYPDVDTATEQEFYDWYESVF